MPNLDDELDEIIARQKPGYRRVGPAASVPPSDQAAASDSTADLVRKYLGGEKKKGKSANSPPKPGNDVAIVQVRPERESDDPRQNVPKAVVISRSKKKIIGEQG